MKIAPILLSAALVLPGLAAAQGVSVDPAYVKTVKDWRARADQGLRRDDGWLTLAGRYVLKRGENLFGTAPTNDVVFPKGLGPAGMGSIFVEPGKGVRVKLVPGYKMRASDGEFSERDMGTSVEKRDWVRNGRTAFHIIERNGRYVLRLADNESELRKAFGGRVWYDVDDNYRIPATYVPYDTPRTIPIVNVLDEVSEEVAPGYVEFLLSGRPYRLDAVGDGDGLFFVFRDATAGDTTYGPGRFLYVEKKPAPGERFTIDFNKAYNPPCAFSEYTTCPLPPKQNVLPVRVEAGEKYPPLRKEAAGAPPRAAIVPFPPVAPASAAPEVPMPGIAKLDVAAPPPGPVIDPRTGAVAQPGGRFATDPRTGAVLHGTPGGYVDPRTGAIAR